MRNRNQQHQTGSLMALLLFAVFAACILSVLLSGADTYKRLTQRDSESADSRTCLQYTATKVRQAKCAQNISVGDFCGVSSLIIAEEIDGEHYFTRVYCYDGWIRELFTADEADFSPEDGEKVFKAEAMRFLLSNSILTVYITEQSGAESSILLYLRGGEAAV